MWGLRVSMPKRSMWRVAQFDTLRLRLIKIAARVVEMKTMIRVHLPTSCPVQDHDRPLFRIDRCALRGNDLRERVVDRPAKALPAHQDFVTEGQNRRQWPRGRLRVAAARSSSAWAKRSNPYEQCERRRETAELNRGERVELGKTERVEISVAQRLLDCRVA